MASKNILNITKDNESYFILVLLVILILIIYRCKTENFSGEMVDKYIERGPFGVDGKKGKKGEDGNQGFNGDKGPKGISALNELKKNESLGLENNDDIYDASVLLIDYVKSEIDERFKNLDDDSKALLNSYITSIKNDYISANELVGNQSIETESGDLSFESEFPDFSIVPQYIYTDQDRTAEAAPKGWQMCDGAELKLANQQILYKDSNGNTLKTPDLRGRIILGAGNVSDGDVLNDSYKGNLSADEKKSGNFGRKPAVYEPNKTFVTAADGVIIYGSVKHRLTQDEMPSHSHTYLIPDQRLHCLGTTKGTSGGSGHNTYDSNTTSGKYGGNVPHNNMPPYETLNYIIKQPSQNGN